MLKETRSRDGHVKLQTLGQFAGVCQNFSTLESHERGQRSSVKSRILKPEASVHTVGSELKGHLLDIVLI
jgi:hypothetical protein